MAISDWVFGLVVKLMHTYSSVPLALVGLRYPLEGETCLHVLTPTPIIGDVAGPSGMVRELKSFDIAILAANTLHLPSEDSSHDLSIWRRTNRTSPNNGFSHDSATWQHPYHTYPGMVSVNPGGLIHNRLNHPAAKSSHTLRQWFKPRAVISMSRVHNQPYAVDLEHPSGCYHYTQQPKFNITLGSLHIMT
uniref:Uncharacterized protein n=1 Tax=Ananas comosus var. bracteatus TaxID=296719 RepID=A0A6V7PHS8_ANACO|nr:unnamed protein product [Ananas comosus var. bracteatus]